MTSEPISAHGLFKALGHASTPTPRVEQDFYRTPPDATRALLRAERERLRSFPAIWEPACGDGAMVKVLQDAGLTVRPSDITHRGCPHTEVQSFLDFTAPLSNCIITNPPYSLVNWRDSKAAWITHALGMLNVEYMALLLPWSWPGAAGLGPVWERFPPAIVYLMRWRIDFTNQGQPPQLNAWWIWDRGHRGETILRMLDREPRQEKLL